MTTIFLTQGRLISWTLALSDVLLMSLVLIGVLAISGGGDDGSGIASTRLAALAARPLTRLGVSGQPRHPNALGDAKVKTLPK